MEASRILQSDLLDILFESRNKAYGAYALRKSYNKRIGIAVLGTLGIVALIIMITFLTRTSNNKTGELQVRDVVVQNVQNIKAPLPPPPSPKKNETPPPPQKAAAPLKAPPVPKIVETTKFTPPVIKKDEEVKQDIPQVQEVQKVDVATVTGPKDQGIVNTVPKVTMTSVDNGTGVVEMKSEQKNTAKAEDENKVFEKVEIEASVNASAWRNYLQNELARYIEDAASQSMSPGKYTVEVRFLVDKDGSISDAHALNDPGYGLAKGAVDVVKKGPKWTPGEQNGRKVRSYHTQPITFVITEQ